MTTHSQRVRILHSNDIHGRIDGLARIATLVKQERAASPQLPILYLDGGDIEESSVRLSNLTRGTGMHRLLAAAGCDVATIGNGGLLRYGYEILKEYGEASVFPQLLANLRLPNGMVPEGVQAATILKAGELHLGVIGLSENMFNGYTKYFGMLELPAVALVRELAGQLREQGANVVILLSHMGLKNDRELASELQGVVPLIIGAHTHDLLPEGERVGEVLIAQAGCYAQHLGYLDLLWDGESLSVERVRVEPVSEEIPPAPEIAAEVRRIEEDITHVFSEVIGELMEPLDFSEERECSMVNLMADMLRERMGAEVALITSGASFIEALPSGPLTRGKLWEACPSPGNPGVVDMTGTQLLAVIQRGLDPEMVARRPRPLRGHAQGLLHLSGASMRAGQLYVGDEPVDQERIYRVAGSDWELDSYGGYTDPEWELKPTYDMPIILPEALEAYITQQKRISLPVMGRLG